MAKKAYGFPAEEKFYIPDGVTEHFAANVGARGEKDYTQWNEIWTAYQSADPDKAAELQMLFDRKLPDGWDADIPTFEASEKGAATRNSSG